MTTHVKLIKEIRERLEATTPGPWKLDAGYLGGINYVSAEGYGNISDYFKRREDARFVANAPADIAYLLDLVAELDAEIEELRIASRLNNAPGLKLMDDMLGKLDDMCEKHTQAEGG